MESTYNACADWDILAFKGSIHKSIRKFTKRINPYTACECATDEYERSFEILNSLGLGKLSETTSRNRKKIVAFE